MLETFNVYLSATLGIGSGIIISIVLFSLLAIVFNKYYKP